MEPREEPAEELRVAAARRRSAADQRARILATYEQHVIEAEVASTRRRLLRLARGATGPTLGFLGPSFLSGADRPTLYQATIEAAASLGWVASVDLQRLDPGGNALRIVASVGFSEDFVTRFGALRSNEGTACAAAWRTQRPVLVDDVERSPIFADPAARDSILTAGSRAVYSYPLLGRRGEVLGVLSFHASEPVDPQPGAELIARSAAAALVASS